MKLIVELSIILVVLIGIIIFLFVKIVNNQIKIYTLKIDKSSNRLKKLLNDKFNLLLKTIELLKEKVSIDENLLYDFLNTNLKSVSLNDLNNTLIDTDDVISSYYEQNEKLIKDKPFIEINSQLKEMQISINAITDYYNETITDYNKYIKRFPYKMITKLKRCKKKDKLKEQTKTKLKILN